MAESKAPVAKTKEEGIKLSITSTGRQLGVIPVLGTGLVKIAFLEGPGKLPDKYNGKYTATHLAKADLDLFVAETWDVAEEHTKRKSA